MSLSTATIVVFPNADNDVIDFVNYDEETDLYQIATNWSNEAQPESLAAAYRRKTGLPGFVGGVGNDVPEPGILLRRLHGTVMYYVLFPGVGLARGIRYLTPTVDTVNGGMQIFTTLKDARAALAANQAPPAPSA